MYETMTIEQLQAEQTALYEAMKACKAKKRAIDAELDRRAADEEVTTALTKMSPEARAHLVQKIGAAGIPPQAAVGTPGAQ